MVPHRACSTPPLPLPLFFPSRGCLYRRHLSALLAIINYPFNFLHKIACNSQAQAAGSQALASAAAAAAAASVSNPSWHCGSCCSFPCGRSLQQLSLPLNANIANFYLNIAAAAADVVAINQLLVKHLPLQPCSFPSLTLYLSLLLSPLRCLCLLECF